MKAAFTISGLICMMLIASIAWSKTIYVDVANDSGFEDGTPKFPFNTIGDGIKAAANGDIVLVADGIYAGGVIKNKNIIVKSRNGPTSTIIIARWWRSFLFENSSSTLDGFTIKDGTGVRIYKSSPTIINCIIADNSVIGSADIEGDRCGGGISCYESSPTIINCTITGNSVVQKGYRLGGGIACIGGSLKVVNCIITENTAYFGGGIFISPTAKGGAVGYDLINCIITNNVATMGGGIFSSNCYGVRAPSSAPIKGSIVDCTITKNSAKSDGGGIFHSGCSNAQYKIANCIITENSAMDRGGGVYLHGLEANTTNCTITRNIANTGGGIFFESSSARILNTILWGNNAQIGRKFGGSEFFIEAVGPEIPIITYSDVQGSWPVESNIDADPLFVNPESGDYHLQANSPCIDAGDPNSPLDPDGTRADIGVLFSNYSSDILRLDVNDDGIVDIFDLVLIGKSFDSKDSMIDFNGDGVVDISDLVLAAKNFGFEQLKD